MTFPTQIQFPKNKSSRSRPKNKNYKKKNDTNEIVLKVNVPTKKRIAEPVRVFTSVATTRFPQTKASLATKQKRNIEKFYAKIKKLGYKTGQSLSVGIGDVLYHCHIAMIADLVIQLHFQGESCTSESCANSYSIKNVKTMVMQAKHLMDLTRAREKTRARARLERP